MAMFLKIRLADVEEARSILPNYFKIMDNQISASYLKCKHTPLESDLGISEEELWKEHKKMIGKISGYDSEDIPNASVLDLKLKLSRQMLSSCELCERRCRANRLKGEEGHCKVIQSKISSEFVHWGEEPELVPSHTIFFSGCTFNCVFCQNSNISQNPKSGDDLSPKKIAEIIHKRSTSTRNTNWVGGDPTSNLPFILESLTFCKTNIPQVFNSNMYLTEKSMDLLEGVIDVYLTDFKYGNNQCAKRLSNINNYWEVVTRNHLIAMKQCEMIIRHLVLPNHFNCCTKPILEWIAENLENVRVNVMDQYRPEYNAYDYEELTKSLKREEFESAQKLAYDLGLSLTE
jgi:putative pyruvate formate lyase activating enzyme